MRTVDVGEKRRGGLFVVVFGSWLLLLLRLEAGVSSLLELRSELLNAARGVDELQLARIERMAFAANVDLQLFLRAASLKRVAATALNGGFVVLRMNARLHDYCSRGVPDLKSGRNPTAALAIRG